MKLLSAATILALASLAEAKTRNLKSGKSTKSWSYPKTKSCKGGSTSNGAEADAGYSGSKAGSLIDTGDNICAGTKVPLDNIPCVLEEFEVDNARFALGTAEQAGGNVTLGFEGGYVADTEPITASYGEEGMCPVNVHWHAGTEHLSVGEYDEDGKGPGSLERNLAEEGAPIRQGLRCHHYDETDAKFVTPYDWQFCTDMVVGETYEVHWPHSNMGACNTANQYQTPFYDGVFCKFAEMGLAAAKIGVQAQIYTIVNDEDYYYPNLIDGMIVGGEYGTHMTKYTGSTTGDSRSNEMCSQYAGITWQVDRKCHLISASSFDKMCADMLSQKDDMSGDVYPHGSREIVADHLTADNQVFEGNRKN